MKRKALVFLLAIMLVAITAIGMVACEKLTVGESIEGTYYSYENGSIIKSDYITLKDGKWVDSDGMDGTYKVSNGKITLYSDLFGEEVVVYEGTIKDGVIKLDVLGEDMYFCKEGKTPPNTKPSTPSGDDNTPNKPDGSEDNKKIYKTVTFDLNGGNGKIADKQFVVGELMSDLPTPTRDGYTFICWEESFFGDEYTAASVMPNDNLKLVARWQKILTGYSDDYVSFKPASQGYKSNYIYSTYRNDVDKFVYVEITSDDLNGKVGESNNFNLRTIEGMEYKVGSGYTWAWYQGSFNNPNGAQRFTLTYGSNIQFVTISDNSGVVQQTYLLDIYVRHDYYVSLYKNIFDKMPYDKVRVIENDRFPSNTKIYESTFEFDSRVYYNSKTFSYEKFVYSTVITKDWNLYQTYKPIKISADLQEGTLNEELSIIPYTQYFTLPSPEKDDYDFLGWKLENGKYLTNIQGYSGINYISEENKPAKLTAEYVKKKYYYNFKDDVLKTTKTVPVVTYTDNTMSEILEILYVPYNSDCIVPTKVPNVLGRVFKSWQYYYKNANGEFSTGLSDFDFNSKILSPIALVSNAEANQNAIVLNNTNTYRDKTTYTMYLPAKQEYTLRVTTTGNVKFTVNKYGNTNAQNYTATSSSSASVKLNYYVYDYGSSIRSTGNVTISITSLSGSFSVSLSGATSDTQGSPINTNSSNTATVGEKYTVPLTKAGYAFVGWYDGDNKVSEDEFITMQNKDMTYTAKWINCPVSLDKNIAEAGSVSGVSGTTTIGQEATITATTNSGYTFVGWYNGDTELTKELSYTFNMPAENVTYTAKWSKVTLSRSNTSAGSVSSLTGKYKVGDEVTITATTNNGNTFVGWYNGETELTKELNYTFNMPAENVTYTAKWSKVTLSRNNTSAGSVSSLTGKYKVGDEVTITATTNNGYTFVGWYNGETELTKELSYTFNMPSENVTYTAKWTYYTLTTTKNDNSAGSITSKNAVKTTAGQSVTITATTNSGYTFVGWYNEDILLSTNEVYTFNMPAENVTYTAHWTYYTLTTEADNTEAGSVTAKNAVKTTAGQSVTINAMTNYGYTFEGWYNGDTLLSTNASYTFNMPFENITYTAKWTYYTLTVNSTEGGTVNPGAGTSQAVVSFNLNGATGNAPASQTLTKNNTLLYPSIPTRSGYVFAGWYENSACSGSAFDFSSTIPKDTVLYAKWISYSGAGVLNINGSKSVSVVKKDSSSKSYYAFVPLSNGEVSVYTTGNLDTYGYLYNSSKTQLKTDDDSGDGNNFKITYSVTAGTLYYISPCGYNSAGTTTLYLTGDLPQAGGGLESSGELDFTEPQKITVGDIVKLKAQTNDGYTFVGWYNGETELSKELEFTYTMTSKNTSLMAKWIICPVTISVNDPEAGSVNSLPQQTVIGEEYTVTATTNAGYTWLGWYNGDIELTKELSYTFNMLSENVTYTAKWSKVTLSRNNTLAGSISTLTDKYKVGDQATITATTNMGYTFVGWYNGDIELTKELSYTFNMPSENVTYTAKWNLNEEMSLFNFNSTESTLTILGVKDKTLTNIIVPDYATSINKGIFSGCNNLISITIPFVGAMKDDTTNTHFGYIFGASSYSDNGNYVPLNLKEVIVMGGDSIGDSAFSGCSSLTSIEIPNSVTGIGYNAFYGCINLKGVYITDIASWCAINFGSYNANPLSYAHNLYLNNELVTELVIPEGVTSIGKYAFSYCSSLTSIEIPSSVTSIGGSAFSDCSSLTIYCVAESKPSEWRSDWNALDYNNNKVPVVWNCEEYGATESGVKWGLTKNGTITIGGYSGTSTEVVIPETIKGHRVTNICEYAFFSCSSITSIEIPNSVTSIGDRAFYDCSSLTSITFGENSQLTSIGGYYAFRGCSSLTSIEIPSSVTSIGYGAFYDCSSLISIEIPSSVTSIGYGAFVNCNGLTIYCEVNEKPSEWDSDWNKLDNYNEVPVVWNYKNNEAAEDGNIYYISENGIRYALKDGKATVVRQSTSISGEVVIPSKVMYKGTTYSVTSIGSDAFRDCSSLTSIEILSSVTNIGSDAFYGCSNLTIYCKATSRPSEWDSNWNPSDRPVVWNCAEHGTTLEGIKWGLTQEGVMTVAGYIGESTEVEIPSTVNGHSVTRIISAAFLGCSSLTSIEIPNSVTSIGSRAFYNCSSMTGVYITDIASWCAIEFGNSNANPLSYAHNLYLNNELVTELVIPNSVTSIGNYAFSGCSSLTSIEIPNSVTSIGNYAFSGCSSLTSIEIPSSVTSIGNYAFSGCSSLKNVKIGENSKLTTINSYAFEDCSSLTSIEIPSGVTSIGNSAFRGCSSLTSIEIPSSVTSIEDGTFWSCKSLTSINIPSRVKRIGHSAFRGCSSLTSIEISSNVSYIGNYAFADCSKLTIYCEVGTPSGWSSYWNWDNTTVIWNYGGERGETENGIFWYLTKDRTVTICGYNGTLTRVVIPNKINGYSVTRISDSAFRDCSSLISIEIPDSVTSIGSSAFSGCSSLKNVKIGENSKLTTINSYAFYNCSSLISIDIPRSVTGIGYNAFLGCSELTSIEISNSVKIVEAYVFKDCRNLTIYCEASEKPSGWDSRWNSSGRPVVWGHSMS